MGKADIRGWGRGTAANAQLQPFKLAVAEPESGRSMKMWQVIPQISTTGTIDLKPERSRSWLARYLNRGDAPG